MSIKERSLNLEHELFFVKDGAKNPNKPYRSLFVIDFNTLALSHRFEFMTVKLVVIRRSLHAVGSEVRW